MKIRPLILIICAPLVVLSSANAGTIVYQDDFANTDLANNAAGVGGGKTLFADTASDATNWTAPGGSALWTATAGGDSAYLYSTNAFDLTGATSFILSGSFQASRLDKRLQIGLNDLADSSGLGSSGDTWGEATTKDNSGIGFSLKSDQIFTNYQLATVGTLNLYDAGTALSGIAVDTSTTFSLEITNVGDGGAHTYSLTVGGTVVTGILVAGAFDFNKAYHVATHAQNAGGETYNIESLKLTVIPEPGSYALLAGLTGLVFIMVRRRK